MPRGFWVEVGAGVADVAKVVGSGVWCLTAGRFAREDDALDWGKHVFSDVSVV